MREEDPLDEWDEVVDGGVENENGEDGVDELIHGNRIVGRIAIEDEIEMVELWFMSFIKVRPHNRN